MKKFLIVMVSLIFLLSNCKKDDNSDIYGEMREIAWSSLSSSEKSTVISNWKHANVELITYLNQNVYAVSFNTNDDALLGPITVCIDPSTKIVVGRIPRA